MIQTLFGSTEEKKTGLFERMKQAVTRTRENLAERIEEVVAFGKEIDRNTLDDLEATLIGADLGSTTTQEVLGKLARQGRPQTDQRRAGAETASERRIAGHSECGEYAGRSKKWTERRK